MIPVEITVAETTLHIEEDRIADDISDTLSRYLDGKRVTFDQPVNLSDLTAFQQTVLTTIRDIPYGETRTYSSLAKRIRRPDAVRAVANACGANPVPIVIPCHRVVAKQGLGGYTAGRNVKRYLLALEGASPPMPKSE